MVEVRQLERTYRAVKTGKNNLIVTLPRQWCEENGVKAGDALTMYIYHKGLVVQYEQG